MWVTVPGPWRSARTTRSPAWRRRLAFSLRPRLPPDRAAVGFSRVAAVGSVAGVAPGLLRAKASGAPLASLPDPKGNPIEHVVVLMMENRSFDHYFGSLALTECRPDVRGLSADMANVGADGRSVKVFKMTDYCQ